MTSSSSAPFDAVDFDVVVDVVAGDDCSDNNNLNRLDQGWIVDSVGKTKIEFRS